MLGVALISWSTLLVTAPVEARLATPDDANSEVKFYHRKIRVKSDGSYVEEIETKVKVLKDTGRTNLATHPLYYEPDTQKLTVLQAQTFFEDKQYVVEPGFIEDKPVASNMMGFNNYRQTLISYPHVQIGSELYLKYQRQEKEASLPNTFATSFLYGSEGYWKASEVEVTSEIPLQVGVNDPEEYLDVSQTQDGDRHVLKIHLKKPLIKQVLNETYESLAPKNYPWVTVTTSKSWSELADQILPHYEKVLEQPLPPLFQSIAGAASEKKSTTARINAVTSSLAAALHYMGDWRSNSGKLYPRSLTTIADNRRSDCKDFSTSTVAILRRMGIQASVALVRRGGYYDDPNDLPTQFAFNHAIVRVKDGDRILWIDPTNFASFADGLFPDIADRYALPLLPGANRERIPAIRPEHYQTQLLEKMKFVNSKSSYVEGTLLLKGVAAISSTGATLRYSKETFDHVLMSFVANPDRIVEFEVKPYELTSRIVEDLDFHYQYTMKDSELKTNAGPAHIISGFGFLNALLVNTKDRYSDLVLNDAPGTFLKKFTLDVTPLRGNPLSCRIQSPWVDVSRTVNSRPKQFEVQDVFTIKKSLISNAELKSQVFKKLQDELEDCLNNVAVVFKKK